METVQGNVTGKSSTDPFLVPKARRVSEACRVLGISRSTMYRLAAQVGSGSSALAQGRSFPKASLIGSSQRAGETCDPPSNDRRL